MLGRGDERCVHASRAGHPLPGRLALATQRHISDHWGYADRAAADAGREEGAEV
jgi:hypothetical protein